MKSLKTALLRTKFLWDCEEIDVEGLEQWTRDCVEVGMEESQLTTTDYVKAQSTEADTQEFGEQSNLRRSQRERKPKTYIGDPLLYKAIPANFGKRI